MRLFYRLLLSISVLSVATAWGQRPTETYAGKLVSANEVIIKLRQPGTTPLSQLLNGIPLPQVIPIGTGVSTHLVRSSNMTVAALIQILRNHPELADVEHNHIWGAS